MVKLEGFKLNIRARRRGKRSCPRIERVSHDSLRIKRVERKHDEVQTQAGSRGYGQLDGKQLVYHELSSK